MTESINCSFLSTSNSHYDQFYLFLNYVTFFLLLLYLISYQRQLTFIGIFLLFNTFGDLFVLLKVIMGFECPLRYKCIVQVLLFDNLLVFLHVCLFFDR